MKKIVKILWLILIICIVIYGIVFWKYYSAKVKNDDAQDNKQGESKSGIKIDAGGGYRFLINLKSVDMNVRIGDEEYTKLLVEFKNYNDTETIFSNVHYEIIDEDGYTISFCNGSEYYGSKFDDALLETFPPNKTVEGYLYCKTAESHFDRFKVSVPTGIGGLTESDILTYEYYYIDLK